MATPPSTTVPAVVARRRSTQRPMAAATQAGVRRWAVPDMLAAPASTTP